ncbi:MAG TPA: MBL fold metallo-hydrolase [Actinomycetota bacterium]|nr:MBL fold metallo-hydrolase [Actinomycetota bacterium]
MEHRRREPAPGIFRLVLPLPFPGLDSVNAFLLADPDGHTLVDCGMHLPDEPEGGWPELVAALETAGTGPGAIARLVVTHPHIDHYGLASRVVDETGCELWMHETSSHDLDLYRDPDSAIGSLRELLADHGVDEAELDELTAFEDWSRFISGIVEPTNVVIGGEKFNAGSRAWEIVYTPGHADAHICVWSPADRILISGDHLLPTITPHIDFERYGEEDPLGEFLDSLAIIERLDPALVLLGHGAPFREGAERARIVARHHDRRLGSILQVIRREPHTAEEITEAIFGETLLNFQKRLALGEALAHIAYLRKRGEVERIKSEDGAFRYVKKKRSAPEPVEE